MVLLFSKAFLITWFKNTFKAIIIFIFTNISKCIMLMVKYKFSKSLHSVGSRLVKKIQIWRMSMKIKLKKSLALLLLIVLSLFNSSIVFAHTHDYNIFKQQIVTYSDEGSNHTRTVASYYGCSCGDEKQIISSVTYQSHTYSSGYTYTGYNYHSGTRHYFEMAKYCIQCNHKDAYFDSKICSGPPCTIPY